VTQTAQAHPPRCLAIAFTVASTEFFVGLFFILPGFAVLVAGMSELALRRFMAVSIASAISWASTPLPFRPLPQNWPCRPLKH
jgi:hypothetical protein